MPLFDWLSGDRPRNVRDAVDDLRTMLHLGSGMFAEATAHILDNEILDTDLDHRDDEIDQREAHLRRVILEFVQEQPGKQLVYALKLLSIVQEAERIGDLCKTIAELSRYSVHPRLGPAVLPLRELRNGVQEMFALTQASFEDNDPSRAEEVLRGHVARKKEVTAIIQNLATGTSAGSIDEVVVLVLAARMMGRISSHLANIASTVVFPFDQIRRNRITPPSR